MEEPMATTRNTPVAPASPAADDTRAAIEAADAAAGGDDARFLQLLEARLHGAPPARFRGRAVIPLVPEPVPQRSFQVHRDPRYLANARELARRTGGGFRVIGGQPVAQKDFLDCVAVGNDQQWGCTGTLIAPNVVVTAGHCAAFATRVFVGRDTSKKGKVVSVANAVRHPSYNHNGHNDLMVLVLSEAIAGVAPRALAGKALIDKATDGRIVGFGNSDPSGTSGYGIKRFVDVPIVSNACRGGVGTQQDKYMYGCDAGRELVAGRALSERDSCTGDSGGPFYVLDSTGRWLLAGATSRATDSAMSTCGDGGIYVRIDTYKTWIASIPGVDLP
jgi:secreted trypsin-like serine protease